jgi:sec-independent protein translocase protein TatC
MAAQPSPEDLQNQAELISPMAADPPVEPGEMTLIEHLKELRNRAIISSAAVVVGILVCVREEFPDFRPAVFSPTESIGIMFKIGLYGGLLLASPVVVYQFIAFVLPGLTPKEKRMIFPGLIGVVAFLMGGMAFAYWVILPASLGFLLTFADSQFDSVIGAKQYLDFVIRIIFWVGLSFELPMVLALLARLGLVTWRKLLAFWRYAIVLVFVIAAIVTPTPDPLTQSFVAGPLLFLYFVGVFFAFVVGRKREPRIPGGV